jgi:uncharacterized membrane protein
MAHHRDTEDTEKRPERRKDRQGFPYLSFLLAFLAFLALYRTAQYGAVRMVVSSCLPTLNRKAIHYCVFRIVESSHSKGHGAQYYVKFSRETSAVDPGSLSEVEPRGRST